MDAYRGQALNCRIQIVVDSEKIMWHILQRQQASPQNTELIISTGTAKVTSAVKEQDEQTSMKGPAKETPQQTSGDNGRKRTGWLLSARQ